MANLTRFSPLGEMVSLRHAMDRPFGSANGHTDNGDSSSY